jgi:hypothetical protein
MADRDTSMKTNISINVVEVLNEEIYDLLATNPESIAIKDTKTYDQSTIHDRAKILKPNLTIRTFKNKVVVEGLTEWEANNIEEIDNHLETALKNRHKIGERLCRTHILITVKVIRLIISYQYSFDSLITFFCVISKVIRINNRTGVQTVGSLKVVDLASSNKVIISSPGVTSIDLKESQYVNRGLVALEEIVQALQKSHIHPASIPYRMSTLTALLQDVVRIHKQVTFIIHIAPEDGSDADIISTLDFGSKCR